MSLDVRIWNPWRGEDVGRDSLLFFHLNHGKSSRVVDRELRVGQDALAEIAKAADVIIVGLDEDRASLRRASPQSIICLVSDFGETGPLSGWLATDWPWRPDWLLFKRRFGAGENRLHGLRAGSLRLHVAFRTSARDAPRQNLHPCAP